MSPEEKQRNKVQVSLTDAEYSKLSTAAGEEPLGTFIRQLIQRYLARRRK